ncbi:MAG: iron complex outerrane recepter protein, partial [Mucilaginibacter sp.]|nr:iron complex outerrane recepter protein [Mucilaginibacter sp.]
QSPTTNAVNLLRVAPGVIVASNDSLGTSDRMSISMRGLFYTEIGGNYEGMPAGDRLYYTQWSTEWSDTENFQKINVSQGSPDISAPAYNAVGGMINAVARRPSDHFGAYVDVSAGSKSLDREFIRIDTGELGNSGVANYTSFSHEKNDNWRGSGGQTHYHLDSHFLKEWGDNNRIAPFVAVNYFHTNVYNNPTLAQWQQNGTSSNFDANYVFGDTNYYKFRLNQRLTVIAAVPSLFTLAPGLTLSTTPYFYQTRGYINGSSVLNNSAVWLGNQPEGSLTLPYSVNGRTTVENVDGYRDYAVGQNTNLSWTKGANTLQVGFWYDYFDHIENISYMVADLAGNVQNSDGRGPVRTQSGAVLHPWDGHIVQQTNAIYISDTLKMFDDRLVMNAGFKEVLVSRKATNFLPGPTPHVNSYDAVSLPQASISYQITPNDRIYINGTTAFREPSAMTSYVDFYNVATGVITNVHANSLKPEYSISEEIGFRHYGSVNVSAAVFNYNLTNRQISSTVFVNGSPQAFSINGGGQTIRGVQAEASMPAWHNLSPYVSGQYLHATMNDNLPVNGDFLPTRGKTAVVSPTLSGAVGLAYDDNSFFGNIALNYVGSQYSTFMNDQSIPAYKTANVTLGYRFRNIGPAKFPQIQLNLVNIGNEKYLSGVNGFAANAKATQGINGTTINGGNPNYFVGGGFGAVISVSAGL